MEKLKLHLGGELSMRYELKTKGTEKIIAENERLRKELRKVRLKKMYAFDEVFFIAIWFLLQ